MNVLRKIVVGLAGIFVIALAFDLAAPKAVHAVVSTLVTVTNTPNVSVVNTPSVNVASPVAVTNSTDSGGNPIPLTTQDPTYAARNSFSATAGCNFNGAITCQVASLSVPQNEIAVIQSITGDCVVDPAAQVGWVFLTFSANNGTLSGIYIQPGPASKLFFGNVVSFGQNITAYAAPNQTFELNFYETAPSSASNEGCSAMVSGYFVHQ